MTHNKSHVKIWLKELRSYAKEEFISHLPYTLTGALLGLGFVFLIPYLRFMEFGEREFHIAHFIHIFFSAAAGAAIFRSYQGRLAQAIPVVSVSSIGLCTLSDSLIPFIGLWIFQTPAHVHLCVFEHPVLTAMHAALGFALGFVGIKFFRHCNRGFHLLHILISTLASAIYIMSFVDYIAAGDFVAVLVTLFFSISVPCLVGDVVLPLCFVDIRDPYLHEKMHHSH